MLIKQLKKFKVAQLALISPAIVSALLCWGSIQLFAGEAANLYAQDDLSDPFDIENNSDLKQLLHDLSGKSSDTPDDQKSIETLLREGTALSIDGRYLDARSKWLKILQRDPKEYRAMIELGRYYLSEVGHYRLSLKYLKQAEKLFLEHSGKAPYSDPKDQITHATLLYLISQARLNLDNYPGALQTLDEYTKFGYYADWMPGSRAWILMKMGQISEAIKVARLGYMALTDARERGQILNMLGILLSMDNQRQASLQIFQEAIKYEFSMGDSGQPATPLNNSGEVYKESFEEDKAESSWLKATSLKDGCDHVLPSLNLAMLYIEQLNFSGAQRAIDNFESCVAQFPLRNGEEHRALVHLARGRIDLHTGQIERAVDHLESALSRQQWFGKIGTSVEDLVAGGSISLSQALRARINLRNSRSYDSWASWIEAARDNSMDRIRAWWLARKARQVMAGDLADVEDLNIRNTDSLIEYPTFGSFLSAFPLRLLEKRIERERSKDDRNPAIAYYRAYLAESLLTRGDETQGRELLKSGVSSLRTRYDDLLKLHCLLLDLKLKDRQSPEYRRLSQSIFNMFRPALRNYGLPLPVSLIDRSGECTKALKHSAFVVQQATDLDNSIECQSFKNGYQLQFKTKTDASIHPRIEAKDLSQAINQLADEVFVVKIGSEQQK